MTIETTGVRLEVRHVAKGRVLERATVEHTSRTRGTVFVTPALDLSELVWRRTDPCPASDVPMKEVLDYLAATGDALDLYRNVHLQEAVESAALVNETGHAQLERQYRSLAPMFDRAELEFELEQAFGAHGAGWSRAARPTGETLLVRPFPARMLHVLAGNGPGVSAITIIRGALSRGVSLMKLPSNELFAAPAILATMADLDPDHPVLRSFSAAYWRGGDDKVESVLYRPQFFDKVVAWGGEAGIGHVMRHVGPGLELVSMDPKTSISVIGHEAFADPITLADVARRVAADVGDQEGCQNSRVQFVQGSVPEVDAYCEMLLDALRVAYAEDGSTGRAVTADLRAQAEVLRTLPEDYGVWGGYDGDGLVIRTDDPIDVELTARTVNVVPVASPQDAVAFVGVATQTVGIFPVATKQELRDAVGGAGAQRIVTLGHVTGVNSFGRPHDAMYPLHRMVRWVVDEEGFEAREGDACT